MVEGLAEARARATVAPSPPVLAPVMTTVLVVRKRKRGGKDNSQAFSATCIGKAATTSLAVVEQSNLDMVVCIVKLD
jgi:hypothetical protein